MGYRWPTLPKRCKCMNCGYVLENPGNHCRYIPCPRCGGKMYRLE